MNYIFESLINRYDDLVIQEYCYGESYYTEEAKSGVIQKILKFITDLCTKIMNKIKEIINKIAGKEVFVKAPKDMEKKVKETESCSICLKNSYPILKKECLEQSKN